MNVESVKQTFKEIDDRLQMPGISENNANVKEIVKHHLCRDNIDS